VILAKDTDPSTPAKLSGESTLSPQKIDPGILDCVNLCLVLYYLQDYQQDGSYRPPANTITHVVLCTLPA
jgi:hypothetical protein